MIAIYTRVSSDSQITASQDREISRWVEREGYTETDLTRYVDQGESGTTMKRPQMERLLGDLHSGDKIVIWRMDRLGRTAAGLTKLFEDLIELGVSLLSIRDGFDLCTPSGRLMANVLASVAQFETEVRRERIRAGIAAAKARGVKWGGRKKGAYKGNEKRALELKARGLSYKEIAQSLGICQRSAIKWVNTAMQEKQCSQEQA